MPNGDTQSVPVTNLTGFFENLAIASKQFGLQLAIEVKTNGIADPAPVGQPNKAPRIAAQHRRVLAAPARRSAAGKGKVDEMELRKMMSQRGFKPSEAARHFNVNSGLLYYYLGKIKKQDKMAKRAAAKA
jgi:hypothetical protein